MKRVILLAGLLVLVLSCAPASYRTKPAPPPPPQVTYAAPREPYLFEAGKAAFEHGDFTTAIEKLDRFIKENPSSELTDDALFLMAQLFLRRENPYEALRYFDKIERNFRGSNTYLEALYGQAFCWYKLKDYQRAKAKLAALERFELPNPLLIRVLTLKGHLCVMEKKFLCAIKTYQAARNHSKNPTTDEILKGFIAKVVFKIEDEETLNQLIQNNPQGFTGQAARIRQAERFMFQKRYKAARDLLAPSFLESLPDTLKQKAASVMDRLKRVLIKKVIIGCLLPLSGNRAPFGLRALKGALLAAESFQETPKGIEITLIVKDTKSSPKTTAAMVKALVDTFHVQAIVGPMFLDTTRAAATALQGSAIPLISLSQADGIPELGENIFRNCLTPTQQIRALVTYLIQELKIHKAAVLYPNTPFGIRYMKRFWNAFEDKGGEIRGAESYLPSDTDFGTPIKKLVGLYYTKERWMRGDVPSKQNGKFDPVVDFEALFIPDIYSRVVLIAPQLAFYDILGVTLAGINTWNSPLLFKEGKQFVRGAIFTDGFSPKDPAPFVKKFVNDFNAIFGETPEILAAQAFDAIKILVQCFQNNPLEASNSLLETLREDTGFHGVSGLRYFDSNGEAIRTVLMLTVTRRGIEALPPLTPLSTSTP